MRLGSPALSFGSGTTSVTEDDVLKDNLIPERASLIGFPAILFFSILDFQIKGATI